jgi:hypothetical protein
LNFQAQDSFDNSKYSIISLERNVFHRLNQLNNGKTCLIKVGYPEYHDSEIQLFLISLEAVENFSVSKDDFVVDEHDFQAHSFQVTIQDLIACFDQID